MPDNETNKPNNPPNNPPKGGGGGGGGGGGSSRRKGMFDQTNMIGYALWFASAAISAVAFANVAVRVPVTCRGEDGFIVPNCVTGLANTSAFGYVMGFALVIQVLTTVARRRVRHPVWSPVLRITEVFVNLFGFYWLFCVQLGMFPGIRVSIQTFVQNFGVPELVGTFMLITLAYGWDKLADLFFDAPAPLPPGARR